MSLTIYSDPHWAATLMSHTTPESRKRMREMQKKTMGRIISLSESLGSHLICGGDFFDSHRVDENTFLEVIPLVSSHELILSGNHDVLNTRYSSGSLDVMAYFNPKGPFLSTVFGEAVSKVLEFGKEVVFAVPHCTNQQLFEESLEAATESATGKYGKDKRVKYLLLHCNYDNPAAKETELNLSRAQARKLLQSFDYVVLGHEHNFRTDFEDRLIVIGNMYPLNFGDLSDKFCLVTDKDGHPELEQLWDCERHYLTVNYKDILQAKGRTDLQFLRVVGECPADQLYPISKEIKGLWDELTEVIAIRLDVEVEKPKETQDFSADGTNLLKTIEKELEKSPELLEVWKEYTTC